jgi:hypothetical protein
MRAKDCQPPELLRGDETRRVWRIRHAPPVNHERDQADDVANPRHRVQSFELCLGLGALVIVRVPKFSLRVANRMKCFELRFEDSSGQQSQCEHSGDQSERNSAKGPARIEVFSEQV